MPFQLSLIWKDAQGHTQRCVSMVILETGCGDEPSYHVTFQHSYSRDHLLYQAKDLLILSTAQRIYRAHGVLTAKIWPLNCSHWNLPPLPERAENLSKRMLLGPWSDAMVMAQRSMESKLHSELPAPSDVHRYR